MTQQQEYSQLAEQYQEYQNRIQNMESNLRELRAKHQRLSEELNKLVQQEQTVCPRNEAQFNQMEAQIQQIRQQCTQLSDEEERLQKELLDAGGAEVPGLRQKIEQLQNEINNLESNISKGESEINQVEKLKKERTNKIQKLTAQLDKFTKELEQLASEKDQLEEVGAGVDMQRQKLAEQLQELENQEQQLKGQYEECKTGLENNQRGLAEAKARVQDMESVLRQNTQKLEGYKKEYDIFKLRLDKKGIVIEEISYPITDIQQEDQKYAEYELQDLQLRDSMRGLKSNQSAIDQYERKDKEYRDRKEALDYIIANREQIRKEYERLRMERTTQFMQGLDIINTKLGDLYNMMTLGGGAAMLELVDNSDPFESGVNFSVRPPSKSWRNINFLSGGEKTLSSLAFIFALHHFKPSPIYILDEIDAA
eukprot:TRINITY_DN7083_c0_g1_i1.p1 TRINITY_DN7083_c0_g1~~TRINITY_DN7083_c0_g1_i1.p1  ORF type:complete len:475 (-),score=95.14 TRINITY_DN7083_c0_g1_i1:102-1373(-)